MLTPSGSSSSEEATEGDKEKQKWQEEAETSSMQRKTVKILKQLATQNKKELLQKELKMQKELKVKNQKKLDNKQKQLDKHQKKQDLMQQKIDPAGLLNWSNNDTLQDIM